MKRKITSSILIALTATLLGCGTTQITKEQACSYAVTAYGVYLAVINANGTPTKEQIMAAQAAAVVLATQCGWQPPTVLSVTAYGDESGTERVVHPMLDRNQVPVIAP